jgi:DNA-binding protein YbaB
MAAGDEELLAEMRSTLEVVRAASEQARRRASEARTTVEDKERLLSATVGGHGELRELTFHGTAYRELAPAELANLIVTTVRQARDRAQQTALAGSAKLTGDLSRLSDTAHRAKSFDELIDGIVGLVTTTDSRRDGFGVR